MLGVIAAAGAAMILAVGVVGLARARPGYRHRTRSISELGERGSPVARATNLGLFVPVGLLCAVAAFSVARNGGVGGTILAASLAAGYLVAALCPCDQGCPPGGTPANKAHLIAGVAEYLGGVVGLLVAGFGGSPVALGLGVAVVGLLGASMAPRSIGRTGLFQRLIEVALFAGLVVVTTGNTAAS